MLLNEFVVYEKKLEHIYDPEDSGMDLRLISDKIKRFICSKGPASIIKSVDKLLQLDVAFFECGQNTIMLAGHCSLSDVMACWTVEGDVLTVKKLWYYKNKYMLEIRKFWLENYGRTWRCWTAVPTVEQVERTTWDELRKTNKRPRKAKGDP